MIKLDSRNVEDIIALSPMQEGMLFFYLNNKESNVYHELLSFGVTGEIEFDTFKKTWDYIMDTNEMLRTVFRWEGLNNPVQITLKNHEVPITFYDFHSKEVQSKTQSIEEIKLRLKNEKLDITKEPFNITLVKLNNTQYEMIFKFHHIIIDGWSTGVLLKEFTTIYDDLHKGNFLIPPKKKRYKEFIAWYRKQDKEKQKGFWSEYIKDTCIGTFTSDYDMLAKPERKYEYFKHSFPETLVEKMKQHANKYNVTLATLLYCAWGILLQRYNNSEDVVFGTTVSGRIPEISGIEEIVGLFINTVPLRVKVAGNDDIISMIRSVDKSLKERKEFESTPITDIKSFTKQNNREKLFDSIVVIENYPVSNVLKKIDSRLRIQLNSLDEETNFDMTVEFFMQSGIEMKLIYNCSKFDSYIINKVKEHYINILSLIVRDPGCKVSEIDFLSQEEKHKLLVAFDGKKKEFPSDSTIHKLFEKQVKKSQDNIAIVSKDKRITYKELNEKANSLANRLINEGVKRNDVVAIMVEQSIDLFIGMLAILKAGAVFMPIRLEYPDTRAAYMLKDSKANILITYSDFKSRIQYDLKKIYIDNENIYNESSSDLCGISSADDLAYIIYTSGTTGDPKGVMVNHKSLVNLCSWHIDSFNITEKDRSTKYADIGFDASVWEIFPYIISGATIYIIGKDIKLDMYRLNEYYEQNGITISFLPTPICENFMELENLSLRILLTGGDKLKKYLKRNYLLINNYGPTENTVVTTSYLVTGEGLNIPIGKPIYNTHVYILDNHNRLQPVGIPGELCISGESLAKGYLGKEDLTEEKFVQNPFYPSQRMYRTGDIARWIPDGNIEFLGRIDSQVKIRGYRIEVGEIENCLLKYESIKEAVVIAKESYGDKNLYAYFTAEEQVNITVLRQFLSEILPYYMIPLRFIQLENIPLTSNGKIDHKALIGYESHLDKERNISVFQNDVEEKLIEIWKGILGVEIIGTNENFFDLGGNSILLIRMHSRLQKVFNTEFEISNLFSYPTISKLAEFIDKGRNSLNKDFHLGLVELTEEFFVKGSSNRETSMIRINLRNDVFYKLKSLAKSEKVDISDLLFAIFAYLLKEINGQQNICIQSLTEDCSGVFNLNVDFNLVHDFSELFNYIHREYNEEQSKDVITVEQFKVIKANHEKNLIKAIFCKQAFIERLTLTNYFDIVISAKEKESEIELICEHTGRLKKERVKDMLQDYIKLIEQIIFI